MKPETKKKIGFWTTIALNLIICVGAIYYILLIEEFKTDEVDIHKQLEEQNEARRIEIEEQKRLQEEGLVTLERIYQNQIDELKAEIQTLKATIEANANIEKGSKNRQWNSEEQNNGVSNSAVVETFELSEPNRSFLDVDTSEYDAEIDQSIRENVGEETWAEWEQLEQQKLLWINFFEEHEDPEIQQRFKDAVNKRLAAEQNLHQARTKALGIDFEKLYSQFPPDTLEESKRKMQTMNASSSKRLLRSIQFTVAEEMKREQGMEADEDGFVTNNPERAFGNLELSTKQALERIQFETEKAEQEAQERKTQEQERQQNPTSTEEEWKMQEAWRMIQEAARQQE